MSLIEMMLAISVFAITISTSMAVAATYFKGSFALRKYQENSEELSLATNYVSKDIRMSNSLIASLGSNNKIKLTNNADDSELRGMI